MTTINDLKAQTKGGAKFASSDLTIIQLDPGIQPHVPRGPYILGKGGY